jgi:hypothetical protein
LTREILELTDNSLFWQFSRIVSRNPYQSQLFLNCCYLILIERLVDKGQKIDEIIVPSIELKRVIDNYVILKELKINVSVLKKTSFFKNFNNEIVANILFCWNLYSTHSRKRKKKVPRNMPITLIDTFILSNSIQQKKYVDRYYPGMLDYLTEHEKSSLFFIPTLLEKYSRRDIKNINSNSKENFIFQQDFLHVKDYISAIYTLSKKQKINSEKIYFKDFNILPILKSEIGSNNSTLRGLLYFNVFKRLSENNIKIRLAIDWFENHQIDKGFNCGIHTFFPKAEHVGYKGYINSNDFSFYVNPTDFEKQNHVIPKEINVVGKGFLELSKNYCKELKVNVAPAFRFSGIWNSEVLKQKNDGKRKVLIALPIAYKESLEIVKLIIDATDIKVFDNTYYHFKAHPALDVNSLKNYFENIWPDNFLFVGGSFNDRMLESNMMLGNSSSTCMEALAMGKPVIIIGSQSNLTQNPIPNSITKKIWNLAYTPEELSTYIERFLKLDQFGIEELSDIGRKIKEDYFEPVTKENTRKFLRLN